MDTHDQMFYVVIASFVTVYGVMIKATLELIFRRSDRLRDKKSQENDRMRKEYNHFLTNMYDILYFKSTLNNIALGFDEKSHLINNLNRSCLKSLPFVSPIILNEIRKFCNKPNFCNYISIAKLMRIEIQGKDDKGISKEMTYLMGENIKNINLKRK